MTTDLPTNEWFPAHLSPDPKDQEFDQIMIVTDPYANLDRKMESATVSTRHAISTVITPDRDKK